MQKKFIKSTFILTTLILMIFFGIARADDSKTIYDQYFIYKIKDSQIGYGHITQKVKTKNGKNIILTNKHSEQKIQRFGFTVKMKQDSQFVEDELGIPVSFSLTTQSPGENSRIQGEFITADRTFITSTVNGIKKTEEIKLNKKILFPYGIYKLFKDNSDKDKIEYSTIDPSVDFRIITFSAEKIGNESLNTDNLSESYTKYKVVMDLLPNINSIEWYDSQGRPVKELSSVFNIESVAVEKDKILSKTKGFDILNQSLIPVIASFTDPFMLDQVNYKVEAQNQDPENVFISDNRQRVIQVTGNTAYLKIKNEHKPDEKYIYPVNSKGLTEFLKSSPFITSKDVAIKAQAISLTGQEKDAYKIVKVMEKWVFDTITKKDFSVNFANAKEVLKTKKGDCTEHSILLASVLRAAGIPSKVVIGLMYTDRPEKAFAYHMWVKAYIGKWVNLDPSFPNENFSPVHIAMYETPLNSLSNRTDIVLNIIKSFTNLKINILNFSQNMDINTNLSSGKLPVDDKFKVSNFFKNSDKLKKNNNNEVNAEGSKSAEEYMKSAYFNYSQGRTKAAFDNFKSASIIIPYNDDYLDINLAQNLAELGFFNLSNEKLKNIYTPEIWNRKISDIKQICFPKKFLSLEQEMILADALSNTIFQKNPNKTIELINSNKELLNNDYTHYVLAKAYNAKNDTKNALEELKKIADKNPDNLTYRFEIAQVYISKNELKKAKNEMDFILKHNIIDEKFSKQLQIQNCWLNFKIERKNKLKSQYYLAKYYQEKGELNSAIDILNKLINDKFNDAILYDLLGDIYLSSNQVEKAKSSYKIALELNKEDTHAITGLGDIEFLKKNYNGSLPEYQKANKISGNSIEIMNKVADNYRLLSEDEEAYKFYNKVLSLDNHNFKANYDLGMMYSDMGDLNKAKLYFIKALSVKPFNIKCWLELARIEINNKNYFLAKTYLIPVNHINGQNPEYYFYLGLIHKNNENFLDARLNFNTALELKPQYSEVLKELKELNSLNQL
ncbi:MAG: transglutaminase domain-containing protein [Candidatus Gastranaerophilales bacterium]|nr:transglutaminase domain-containing protein [Candidatus Gastranaerophilales bacterium]